MLTEPMYQIMVTDENPGQISESSGELLTTEQDLTRLRGGADPLAIQLIQQLNHEEIGRAHV